MVDQSSYNEEEMKSMFENIGAAHSQALDDILKARHTVREFSTIPPDKECIDQIIRAGLTAPFCIISRCWKNGLSKVLHTTFCLTDDEESREYYE